MGNVQNKNVQPPAHIDAPKHASNKVSRKIVPIDRSDDILAKVPKIYPQRCCYLRLKRMQRVHDYLKMEKDYVKVTSKNQKFDKNIIEDKKTINKLRGKVVGIGKILELFEDEKHAIVSMSHSKREFYVPILSIVDKSLLRINSTVLVKAGGTSKNIPVAVVGVLKNNDDETINTYKVTKKPKETFSEIAGLDQQIIELREAVEYPLTHQELYDQMGINSPKGVILYGPPGTGKTLLAKAIANSTNATFLRACGSDLVRKTSGEGPKQIRYLFEMAKQYAPCILFLDEIDAIGTKRFDTSCKGEKEIQRTMLELLNQLDGFDDRGEVKIIMATNRIESLDPALIRPGRIDRKIELLQPDQKSKLRIFKIHSGQMNLDKDINFEKILSKEKNMSGAEIKSICSEAGMLALRNFRKIVKMNDFETALKNIFLKTKIEKEEIYL
ncbi:26S protease regulatory subunit 4 [Strongyloides ratti]|uniref:26S protease regulatory subunit 4 n=1 Tax=Strongyloides ratti TaxID=34506 RepID=A0A090LEX9_STRRB|nr:26S protease regulatory subunit 4 [Strongyloides ratti]CEF68312.1 26S protease regulatory subunit 4 [Strongyloides ratti]